MNFFFLFGVRVGVAFVLISNYFNFFPLLFSVFDRAGFLLGLIRGSGATLCTLLYTWLLTSGITFTVGAVITSWCKQLNYRFGLNVQYFVFGTLMLTVIGLKQACFNWRAARMSKTWV